MKPEIDFESPILDQLTEKLSFVGLELPIDMGDEEKERIVLEHPVKLDDNMLKIGDLSGQEYYSIGTMGPDLSYFKYILIDKNDPNPNNPQVVIINPEEGLLKWANKMEFKEFWGLLD